MFLYMNDLNVVLVQTHLTGFILSFSNTLQT